MKLSYGITVCNELEEIQELVSFLLEYKRDEDEVIITYDCENGLEAVHDYLDYNSKISDFNWHSYNFNGNFSDLKNHTKKNCSGDYIFHLDADEQPHENLIEILPQLLKTNDVDLVWVPRVNTVEDITQEHINKWGWRVSDKGWINFPDYQARIFRNSLGIQWVNQVHEHITGTKTYAHLPPYEELSLYHHKTIDKQEQQNKLYEKILTDN